MGFDSERLSRIFDKTNGNCFHCGIQLCWNNYGRRGSRGAWQVDHGHPRSRGGTDHLNNLWAACVSCNHTKSDRNVRQFRAIMEPRPRRESGGSGAGWILGGLLLAGLYAASKKGPRSPPPPSNFGGPGWRFP